MKRELLDSVPGGARGTSRNVSHTSDGKFAHGNRAASGRRSRAAWRDAFDRACSPSDLEAIARRAVRDAKAGDRYAREIVFAYCLQRPPRLLDVSVSEAGEPADLSDPECAYLGRYE